MNRNAKRGVVALMSLVLLVSGAVLAQDGDDLKPVIFISKMRHDFGKTFESDLFAHEFVVRNKGRADLEIDNVKPG